MQPFNPVGFYSWLISQENRNNSMGDFIADVIRVQNPPSDNASRQEWLLHLKHTHACKEAVYAFEQAWAEYLCSY
jgi:hypothetical protein